jgi:hypothetical protein
MREIFKYGSVGRALREQCLYPEAGQIGRYAPVLPVMRGVDNCYLN